MTRTIKAFIVWFMMIDLGLSVFPIDRELTILLIALLFDGATRLLFPDFRDRMAPMGGIVSGVSRFMNNKLNRDYRGEKALFVRGVIALVILLALSYGAALAVHMLIQSHPRGQILSVLAIFSCLSVTMPWTAAPQVIGLFKEKKISLPDLMAVLKRRRLTEGAGIKNADIHTVSRIVIDGTARSIDRGLMHVAFWYCVPALLGYDAIVTALMASAIMEMSRVIVAGNVKKNAFTTPFVTLDAVVHYIPARLGALLLWIAMIFSPGARPFSAMKCVVKQSHKYGDVNGGWVVAMMAGGLNVALPSQSIKHKWIGLDSASAKAGAKDVRHALGLHYVTFIVSILIISSVLYLSLGA